MINDSESETYNAEQPLKRRAVDWLKVGIVAAVSGLAGGLAAAWWYRNTLKTLRQTGESRTDPHFRIPGDISEEG